MTATDISDDDQHENQLRLLKQQVKAIMEEAVTKKFIHEESPHVLKFCGTVEQCLLDGLKTRTPGFFRYNKLANLYAKVGKKLPKVKKLITQIEDIEARLSSSDDSRSFRSSVSTTQSTLNGMFCNSRRYLWVRVAVTSQLLDKIAEYLVNHHADFYDKSSIMADPVRGKILASLLVGPCALDYTKVKTHDHYWSDPPADELLMRHKLHSRGAPCSPGKRPALNFTNNRHVSSSSDSLERGTSFRDYVESLHQNSKITLLYGKNNVIVQPQEDIGPVPGYLSLHQEAKCLMIKWTPNQLMNGSEEKSSPDTNNTFLNGNATCEKDEDIRKLRHPVKRRSSALKRSPSSYWEFAISVDLRDVVYLHCHQQPEKGGTLVLIGQDGVQWPPIRFSPGGHLLSFLSCLETGLLPHGYLDPPLWSQKGKGKTFPKLRRKSHRRSDSSSTSDEPTDFVFRVTSSSDTSNITSQSEQNDFGRQGRVTPTTPTFDLFQPMSVLPALLSGSADQSASQNDLKKRLKSRSRLRIARSVVFRKEPSPGGLFADHLVQPACECGRYEGTQTARKYRSKPTDR